jgi:ribonuclease-3
VVDSIGPAHERVFTVEAVVGEEVLGQGSAGSKKDAEQLAAKKALEVLKERGFKE